MLSAKMLFASSKPEEKKKKNICLGADRVFTDLYLAHIAVFAV